MTAAGLPGDPPPTHAQPDRRSGIGTHVFCLFGFPSETKAEANETAAFVERNLAARPFFTFSANRFGLQRGSPIHRRPGAYGIEVDDEPDSLRLSYLPFKDLNPGERYTREELWALTKRLYARLYFEEVPDAETADLGFNLWDFLDRTLSFYGHRLVNTVNPYYRRAPHASLTPALLDRRCRLIPPVDLDGESGVLLDPIEDELVRVGDAVRPTVRHFVAHFDAGRTLRANVDEAWAAAGALLSEGAADRREWDDLVLRLVNTSAIYPA